MADCAHIPYLERRPSAYFFRRRIPARIRLPEKSSAKSFLSLSLRTHVPADGKAVARSLTALTDLAFDLMSERMMQQCSAETMALLTELARFQIDVHEAARAVAMPRPEEAANYMVACERATREALHRALALGDREPVRQILRDTAARLGVALDESSADWRGLAHEALKVMLDVSRERERREAGQYDGPTVFFRRAMHDRTDARVSSSDPGIATPFFASPPAAIVPSPCSGDGIAAGEAITDAERQTWTPHAAPAPESIRPDPAPALAPAAMSSSPTTLSPRREPRILVDTTLLTVASRTAIEKGPGIELREAFVLYVELKELGYGENFEARQKRFPDKGKKWKKSSSGNAFKAGEIWVDILGNQPFDQIDFSEAEEAFGIIARIPTYHGKKAELMNTRGFRALV